MPRLTRAFVVVAWLVGWTAGPVSGLAMFVHVVDEHHFDEHLAQEFALAAAHGHHHDLGVAAHSHPADREAASAAPHGVTLASLWPAVASAPILSTANGLRAEPAPTESPPPALPLFEKNCALLL